MQRNKGNKNNPATRVNYEDHSKKFLDWVDSIGLEKTVLGRVIQLIEDRYFVRRAALLFLYSVALSYLIFFQISIPYNFSVGDVAKYDVLSPIAFEMTDEVTTEEKRLKSEFTVPVIYDYDNSIFEKVSTNVIHSFRSMRNYVQDVEWPRSGMDRLRSENWLT